MRLHHILAASALLATTAANAATVIPLSISDATYWHDEYPGGGSGGWDLTQVTNSATYTGHSVTGGSAVTYSYCSFRFDLSGITAPVSSATLNLHMLSCSMDPSLGVDLYHATNAQGAGSNATLSSAGDLLVHTFHGGDATGWLSLDVTLLISSDLANNNPFACFNTDWAGILNGQDTSVSFDSTDTLTPAFRPFLAINAVPEPAAVLILGIGISALALRRRR